jgi:tRNA G18 (ribose-2'-O)-methylase SpoU
MTPNQPTQHSHYTQVNSSIEFPVEILIDGLRTPQNIGMCLRLSEAFGVQNVFLHKESPDPSNRSVKKTAREEEKNLNLHYYEDVISQIKKRQERGFSIISLELTDKSKSIDTYTFTKSKPICLVIGSERNGIQQEILNQSDDILSIDMFGSNSSLNVATSLSIALYEITKQLR